MQGNELMICHPETDEIPAIEQLWIDTFADPPELIEAFMDAFSPALCGWVLRRGREILSSAYLLHGNLFLCEQSVRPAAYIYAVATPRSQRGMGYGGMLMRHFAKLSDERGFLLYTRPASEGLFRWYAETTQMRPATGFAQKLLSAQPISPSLTPRRISASEYGVLREAQLRDRPHIALSETFLRLQEQFLEGERAGYYALDGACCACEEAEQQLRFKELLVPEKDADHFVQAMLRLLDLKEAIIPVPSPSGAATVAYRSDPVSPETNWGLLLD